MHLCAELVCPNCARTICRFCKQQRCDVNESINCICDLLSTESLHGCERGGSGTVVSRTNENLADHFVEQKSLQTHLLLLLCINATYLTVYGHLSIEHICTLTSIEANNNNNNKVFSLLSPSCAHFHLIQLHCYCLLLLLPLKQKIVPHQSDQATQLDQVGIYQTTDCNIIIDAKLNLNLVSLNA